MFFAVTHDTASRLSSVPVFGLDVIRHSLGFLVTVVWVMWVIWRSDILHLVHAATLVASLVWSMPRHLELYKYDIRFGG